MLEYLRGNGVRVQEVALGSAANGFAGHAGCGNRRTLRTALQTLMDE